MPETTAKPEFNVTGHDYSQRSHFRYAGPPIVDFHAHVTRTWPQDTSTKPHGPQPEAAILAAERILAVAEEFGITRTLTMCPVEDVEPLRQRLGDRLLFNAMISQKPDDPPDTARRTLDRFLDLGIHAVKLWAAPRGRERGLTLDAPWRINALRHAQRAGVRVVMVHVGDPDRWFQTVYRDAAQFGTKPQQYEPLERLLQEFPDLLWVGAHLGGDPEHPEHLEALFERYPHFHVDTSATKWQVREVSPRRETVRALVCRYPNRFLFGTDLVTRHSLEREHYVSRYWCQRTLWESDWHGASPIADPDHIGPEPTPMLHGLGLPTEVLTAVYHDNAARFLRLDSPTRTS